MRNCVVMTVGEMLVESGRANDRVRELQEFFRVDIKPLNRWIVIKILDDADKIGSIYIPGNASKSYGRARVLAVSECDEAKGIKAGDTVVYDVLGQVPIRIGDEVIQMVKAVNVMGVLQQKEPDRQYHVDDAMEFIR